MSDWKERLGAFDEVVPDEGVYRRAQQGPRRELPDEGPSVAKRVSAGLVAFAIFLGAGAFAWQAFRSGPMPATAPDDDWPIATLELTNDGATRHASLSIDGQVQEGVFGTSTSPDEAYPYDWTNPDIGPPLTIPMGSELRLVGDVQVKEILFGNADELDAGKGPDSGPISSDQPRFNEPYFPPVYDTQREYWKVFGTWADGSVLDVYFEVQGVEPDVDLSDDSVDIVLTPEAIEAVLLYGGQRHETLGSGGYGDSSVISEFVGFQGSSYFPVAAGSTVNVISDDLRSWGARFGRFDGAEGTVSTVIPEELGRTTMRLYVEWGDGSATFMFPIEVRAAPVPGEGATLSFVAKNAPEASLSFGGHRQAAERPEYDWCDAGGCVNGIADYVSYPPVDEFLDIPGGTALTLDGSSLTAIKGVFRTMDGEQASETIERPGQLGTVPVPEGKYALELHVALDGENGESGSATFWFGVRVVETRGAPSGDASDVLRVSCSASGTEVLSPVVAAQADGVRVAIEADVAEVSVEFRERDQIDEPGYGGSGGTLTTFERHPWPIAPGHADVVCRGREFGGQDATPVEFEVVDPNGFWLPGTLDCGATDAAVEVASYGGDAAEYVSKEAAIRGLLAGVDEEDQVGMPFYRGSKDMRHVIVRDGTVVGTVWIGTTENDDPRGGGLAQVSGEVCRSSGIQGNVPPHDPDEDGVPLDCRATVQVAFEAPDNPKALPGPAGPEIVIDSNVENIADADEIILEQPVGGDGAGTYVIIRNGARVASVRSPELDGIACRWSGIGGV